MWWGHAGFSIVMMVCVCVVRQRYGFHILTCIYVPAIDVFPPAWFQAIFKAARFKPFRNRGGSRVIYPRKRAM
jgi:hypothetical protein